MNEYLLAYKSSGIIIVKSFFKGNQAIIVFEEIGTWNFSQINVLFGSIDLCSNYPKKQHRTDLWNNYDVKKTSKNWMYLTTKRTVLPNNMPSYLFWKLYKTLSPNFVFQRNSIPTKMSVCMVHKLPSRYRIYINRTNPPKTYSFNGSSFFSSGYLIIILIKIKATICHPFVWILRKQTFFPQNLSSFPDNLNHLCKDIVFKKALLCAKFGFSPPKSLCLEIWKLNLISWN